MQRVMATTLHRQIYENTVENTPSNEGAIDRRYIKGIPGLLKLLEVVSSSLNSINLVHWIVGILVKWVD